MSSSRRSVRRSLPSGFGRINLLLTTLSSNLKARDSQTGVQGPQGVLHIYRRCSKHGCSPKSTTSLLKVLGASKIPVKGTKLSQWDKISRILWKLFVISCCSLLCYIFKDSSSFNLCLTLLPIGVYHCSRMCGAIRKCHQCACV